MASCDIFIRNIKTNFYRVFYLFLVVCVSIGFSEEEIGSPLRAAQCRARCVDKFPVVPLSLSSCLQDADCNMCWENCQLFQSFPSFDSVCSKSSVCFPGCQEACRFHEETLRNPSQYQQVPVIMTNGEEVLEIAEHHLARWPRPQSSSRNQTFVYIVMKRSPGQSWKQMVQTLDQSTPVSSEISVDVALRVLVVNRSGLVTIYSPTRKPSLKGADIIIKSLDRIGLLAAEAPSTVSKTTSRRINTAISRLSTTNPLKLLAGVEETSAWNLRKISMIHQNVLVIAEIAWDARKTSGRERVVYLVTWEVDGGGLKGNLFTNSTCVTLSLWPETVCHIKVEIFLPKSRNKPEQSEELILDTHRAVDVEIDEPPSGSSLTPSSLVSSSPNQSENDLSVTTVSSVFEQQTEMDDFDPTNQINLENSIMFQSIERISWKDDPYEELVLGVVTALILFFAIICLLAYRHRRSDSSLVLLSNVLTTDIKPKKLVEQDYFLKNTSEPVPVVEFLDEKSKLNPPSQISAVLKSTCSSSETSSGQSLGQETALSHLVNNFPNQGSPFGSLSSTKLSFPSHCKT